ncbi:MAG: IS3 family transposase [Streptosporangiaceae bacterium]
METENEGLPRGVRFPVDFMCRMLGVSRAGYYAWRNRGPSAHAVRDAELTEKIREVDQEQKHRCGIERILWELQEDGLRTSQRRVRRLARAAGVECVHPRPYVRTTLPDAQAREGLVDLVDRDFRPQAADQLWVGDITYLHTFSGFAYLATVIDLFSNKVVGWMVADHMRTGLVLDALDMALAARRPGIGEAVMHTDRGAQYTSHAFRDRCLANGVIPSVGRTGTCYDNAAAESFNATIKKELIHQHLWLDADEVRSAVFDYIECYYNRVRKQRRLGKLSPVRFEGSVDIPDVNAA